MRAEIILPKLGLTMTRGTITSWHKGPGEFVTKGEDLFTFETDKAQNTVQSDFAGTLACILTEAGAEADVFAVIGYIDTQDGAKDASQEGKALQPSPEQNEVSAPSAREESLAPVRHEGAGRIAASPLAKRLAAESGLDLAQIPCANGKRIEKADVEAVLEHIQAKAQSASEQKIEQDVVPERVQTPDAVHSAEHSMSVIIVRADLCRMNEIAGELQNTGAERGLVRIAARAVEIASETLGVDETFHLDPVAVDCPGMYISGTNASREVCMGEDGFVVCFDERRMSREIACEFSKRLRYLLENPLFIFAY